MDLKEYSQRPWGHFHKIFEETGVWVKSVEVNPGARLSLQRHAYRSEKWIIVKGQGLAIVDEKEIPVGPGCVVDVPWGAIHRIGNTDQTPLMFIEVATGHYLAEDDIVRLQDDYARDTANSPPGDPS